MASSCAGRAWISCCSRKMEPPATESSGQTLPPRATAASWRTPRRDGSTAMLDLFVHRWLFTYEHERSPENLATQEEGGRGLHGHRHPCSAHARVGQGAVPGGSHAAGPGCDLGDGTDQAVGRGRATPVAQGPVRRERGVQGELRPCALCGSGLLRHPRQHGGDAQGGHLQRRDPGYEVQHLRGRHLARRPTVDRWLARPPQVQRGLPPAPPPLLPGWGAWRVLHSGVRSVSDVHPEPNGTISYTVKELLARQDGK